VERSLSGIFFLLAAVAISIGAGAWWLQRVAFTPDATRDSAAAVLEEPDIRVELNALITSATAPVLGVDSAQLGNYLENVVLSTRPGAAEMAPIIERIHHLIIGNTGDKVVLSGADMVPIVRDERAYDAPPVTLPITTIGVLSNFRAAIGWVALVSTALGLVAFVLGVFARPERADWVRGIGEFFVALAVSFVLFGYLIPVQLFTAIDNQTWTHAIPRLAGRTTPMVFGTSLVLAVVGGALILAAANSGRRRQGSSPLAGARYRGGRDAGWS
jgi:hypothetical protein